MPEPKRLVAKQMTETATIDAMLASAMRGQAAQWTGEGVTQVWDRIAFHGIAGALNLCRNQLSDWPIRILNDIGQEAQIAALWEETHRLCVAKLIQHLAERGVETVVMKGTALAYSLYEDASVRRRGDTDLLVKPSDRKTARDVLSSSGWIMREVPHGLVYQETWLFKTGAHFVHELDLHWQAIDGPTLQAILPAELYFEEAVPLPNLSKAAMAAPPVLTLVQIALNQAWHQTHGYAVNETKVHGGERLIWAKDYDLLARSFGQRDWSMLAEFCEKVGVGPIVYAALKTARNAFHTPIPEEVETQLAPQTGCPEIQAYLAETDPVTRFKTDLANVHSPAAKARFALAQAWPSAAHLKEKSGAAQNWSVAGLRLQWLARSFIRLVAGRKPS